MNSNKLEMVKCESLRINMLQNKQMEKFPRNTSENFQVKKKIAKKLKFIVVSAPSPARSIPSTHPV